MAFQLTYHGNNAEICESVLAFVDEWTAGMDSFIVSTSGSTGPPKKIVLSRKQLVSSAARTNTYFGLKPGNNVVMPLSPSVIGGKMMIVRALEGNLHLHLTDPASNPLLQLPEDMKIDFIPLVPLQLKAILEETPDKLNNIRQILLGGSPVNADLETRFSKIAPDVFAGFGMTETVSHIAIRKIGEETYSALEGVSFSAENGALIVTDSLLEIGGMKTSDSVELISEKQFKWLGRTDFAINSGGIKIHPEQIEQVLAEFIRHPFIVSSLPDVTFGEVCILIIETSEMTYDLEELKNICKEKMGRFSVPKEIHYLKILTTPAGKTDRIATKNLLLNSL